MDDREWQTVHEENGNNEIAVRVQRRLRDFVPQYSLSIGRRRTDEPERLMIFMPVRIPIDRAWIQLIDKAYDWIEQDQKQYADRPPPARDRTRRDNKRDGRDRGDRY